MGWTSALTAVAGSGGILMHDGRGLGHRVQDIPDEVKRELDIILQAVIETVQTSRVYLFGSYAKGGYSEDSDIDIFVVADNSFKSDVIEACAEVRVKLYGKRKKSLDIIIERESEYTDRAADVLGIEYEVANTGRVIYERH
jgi:predicted nucleotidyltransferase